MERAWEEGSALRRRILLALGLAAVGLTLFSAAASAAEIVVNDTTDGYENGGLCSLREAVEAANTNSPALGCNADTAGADTIVLQSGQTYLLTRHSLPDDTNLNGDLDIMSQVTIQSNGPGLATIDGDNAAGLLANRDRVVHVQAPAGAVTLSGLRIQRGHEHLGIGGGGILSRADLTIIDSEITDNHVALSNPAAFTAGGGILSLDAGSLILTGSTVAGNSAEETADEGAGGGGIAYGGSGSFTATNSTISGNSVTEGGGINLGVGGGIVATTWTLTNVTIASNSVSGAGGGGGLFAGGAGSGSRTLGGTIVAGNTAPTDNDCSGSVSSAGGNLVGDATGCALTGGSNDLTGVPANLGILADNGGPTRTHNLNPGSQAINHGGTCPATDQRGLFRAPVAPCDAGAFELNATVTPPPPPPPPPTTTAPVAAGPTGERAAALAKCAKKKKKARKKCKKKARLLPV